VDTSISLTQGQRTIVDPGNDGVIKLVLDNELIWK
jgi:hypothetical protein